MFPTQKNLDNGMSQTVDPRCSELWSHIWQFTKQEGHVGPVSLHWPICKILSYHTLQ